MFLMTWLIPASALAGPAALPEGTADPAESLTQVLAYVSAQGLVDYAGLKRERAVLDRFSRSLADFPPDVLRSLDSESRIAFWINAYNGLTIQAIVDHYPIKSSFLTSLVYPRNSIRQIPGVWDHLGFAVAGRRLTLDQIEHEILRKDFDEPGIHLALVCAAMSCPRLRPEPYVGERLAEQLADQARAFVADPSKFRIDRDAQTVYVSKIFEWFGADFVSRYQTREFGRRSEEERAFLNYLAGSLSPEEAAYLRQGDYRVRYLDYDWTLNEQPTRP